MIPANAKKPADGRKADGKEGLDPVLLLFNPTYFEYHPSQVPTREEQALCDIQEKFLRGNFAEASDDIGRFIGYVDNRRYLFVAAIFRMLISADSGKKEEYLKSVQMLSALSDVDGMYRCEKYLSRIFTGRDRERVVFESQREDMYSDIMPLISLVNAKKGINEQIQNMSIADSSNYEIICRELEEKDCPLILAYYHLYLAVYHNAMSEHDAYLFHAEKAADILLPRKWYTPFAEYSTTIDLDFVRERDEEAYDIISELSKMIIINYTKVGVFSELFNNPRMQTSQNIRIGFKIIQGKSYSEIAEEMGMSQYKVKQHINDLYAISGASTKKEIRAFILKSFFI